MALQSSRGMLPWVMLLAFLGLIFSLWNVFFASSVPCLTDGCKIFQMASVEGFSLWSVSAGAFIILFIAGFWGLVTFGYIVAAIALVGDIALLAIMIIIAPCASCLVGAFFLGLVYLAFRKQHELRSYRKGSQCFGVLALIWMAFFIINISNVVESSFDVWALPQVEERDADIRPIRAFVSLSCKACEQLINDAEATQAKYMDVYPVMEKIEDLAVFAKLQELRQTSTKPFKEDFLAARETPAFLWHEYLEPANIQLLLRLWRNQAHVVSRGGIVPLVEIQGLPTALMRTPARQEKVKSSNSTVIREVLTPLDATLPIDLGVAGACGEGTPVPCP